MGDSKTQLYFHTKFNFIAPAHSYLNNIQSDTTALCTSEINYEINLFVLILWLLLLFACFIYFYFLKRRMKGKPKKTPKANMNCENSEYRINKKTRILFGEIGN